MAAALPTGTLTNTQLEFWTSFPLPLFFCCYILVPALICNRFSAVGFRICMHCASMDWPLTSHHCPLMQSQWCCSSGWDIYQCSTAKGWKSSCGQHFQTCHIPLSSMSVRKSTLTDNPVKLRGVIFDWETSFTQPRVRAEDEIVNDMKMITVQ